jgi:hypothetical protein
MTNIQHAPVRPTDMAAVKSGNTPRRGEWRRTHIAKLASDGQGIPRQEGRAAATPRAMRSRAVGAAAAMVLFAALTACSVDLGDGDGDSAVGLDSVRQGDTPLLRTDDLGRGYVRQDRFEEADDLTKAGCLAEVERLGVSAADRMAASFATDSLVGSVIVKHSVYKYASPQAAGDALQTWRSVADSCETIERPQDGSVLRMSVSSDSTRYTPNVEAESNVIATGEVDSDNLDVGLSQWVSVAQIGNGLSVVQVMDFDKGDAIKTGQRLSAIAAERLDGWWDKHVLADATP